MAEVATLIETARHTAQEALAACDRAAESFARTRRICDRIAPKPALNLHMDGRLVTRESAELWFDRNTAARDFRRDNFEPIRKRILAKIEARDAYLAHLDKGLRRFVREEGRGL